MTYRDKCNNLHKELVKAISKYQKSEAILSTGKTKAERIKQTEDRNERYKEWQDAQRAYNDFLVQIVHLGKKLGDKIPSSD